MLFSKTSLSKNTSVVSFMLVTMENCSFLKEIFYVSQFADLLIITFLSLYFTILKFTDKI